jgi:hypothetical protein
MNFRKPLVMLKDRLGNPYIGIKFYPHELQTFADELGTHLGDEYDLFSSKRINRDGENYHITLLNVSEFKAAKQKATLILGLVVELEIIGIGKGEGNGNTVYYGVVISKQLDNIFYDFYDYKKDFHVTFGFNTKDVYGICKGVETLI